MQRYFIHRWSALLLIGVFLSLLVMGAAIPITAQGAVFATNTPEAQDASSVLFATNTPPGASLPAFNFATNTPEGGATPEPTVTPAGPQVDLFNYSLRIWLEQSLLDVAYEQIQAVQAETRDADLALQLTLYELERRFPGSPHQAEQRSRLIDAMLQAPAGSIDMRNMVRPMIESVLNQQPDVAEFVYDGFDISLMALNLDNQREEDALVHIHYATEDETILYDDYVLAINQENGTYAFLETAYDLYAAPFGNIHEIAVYDIADVNHDTRDEVVLRVSDATSNDRLLILAFRNDRAVDLAQPGTEIRFGEIVNWPYDNADIIDPTLTVLLLQPESSAPDWPCSSSQEFDWNYDRNFYRQSSDLNSRFVHRDSLGCTLYEAEPLFALAPSEAIQILENALLDYGFDTPGGERALLTLGMFYVLQGRLDDARTTARSIVDDENADPWAARQASAMIEAMGISSNTALAICEAVSLAENNAVCDMDAVLGRYLGFLDLSSTSDLKEQLESAGLPVFETVTVSTVGKADRIAVSFFLANTGWWGFYKQSDGSYAAEPIAAPAGFETSAFPEAQVAVPDAAFDALFVDNDPAKALQILASQETATAGQPFRPEGLYLRALSYDLTASREEARVAFYRIWEQYPNSIWGALASRHLEQR